MFQGGVKGITPCFLTRAKKDTNRTCREAHTMSVLCAYKRKSTLIRWKLLMYHRNDKQMI